MWLWLHTVYIYQIQQTVQLKQVTFTVYKSHLNSNEPRLNQKKENQNDNVIASIYFSGDHQNILGNNLETCVKNFKYVLTFHAYFFLFWYAKKIV